MTTLVLKVVNRCNIDCDYCYVFHGADQDWRHLPARMSIDVARATARRIAEHANAHQLDRVDIALHGGEPLLAGPRHLEELLHAIDEHLGPVAQISLQTNGTLINDRWLDLFDRYEVRVGVSLDGPPAANDRHRLTHRGHSSADAATRGIRLLRTRPTRFAGILAVVDLRNDPIAVFDYLTGLGPPVIDFNLPHATHDQPPYRTDTGQPEYGQWLSRVYDRWITNTSEAGTSVRILEDIIALSLGGTSAVESLGLVPSGIAVIESDGAIEDTDTLKASSPTASQLGLNVFDHTLDDAAHHPVIRTRRHGAASLAAACRRCPLVSICGGGHLPHRQSIARGYDNPSVYCHDLTHLIRHIHTTLPA
ncbi:FxsB family cyclophane-forming radical SAM/SPASM peptide maturase [Catenuloplanes sp. NPDC051500]|uniref:FxsB family cyclophane-forming radical SAM/SPASM peptide maturase n=1 Tax=Catenuloplanes sp. NPDC051500 TaxID=3363959 RepID=UPI00379BBFB6